MQSCLGQEAHTSVYIGGGGGGGFTNKYSHNSVTADLRNLATGSQTVGSCYLGYEPKLYTTMMSYSPYPR